MVSEIILRLVMVAASTLVVASSDFRIKRLAGLIDIQSEASFASAAGTGMPRSDAGILLKTKTAADCQVLSRKSGTAKKCCGLKFIE